jgi:aminoglycoside phosphotransferase (APT) family kinase protein
MTDTAAIESSLRNAGLIPAGVAANFRALTGGVASDIWCVEAGETKFAVKRALAKLRVAADWRAPVSRNAAEADWLATASGIVPGCVPRILFHDPAAGLFAMDFLAPDRHPVWKTELRDGRADEGFAAKVGSRLAAIHAATAYDDALAARFAHDANFHALRLEPYLEAMAPKYPDLADKLFALSRDTLARHVALVHGDVSPKNILVGPDGPVFLDAECAWYGDPAFDLAFCLNHLLLKCIWNPAAAPNFLRCFDALYTTYFGVVGPRLSRGLEKRVARLLPGLLLARIDGKSPVEYIVAAVDKDRVRDIAIPMIKTPPASLTALRDAWRAGTGRN